MIRLFDTEYISDEDPTCEYYKVGYFTLEDLIKIEFLGEKFPLSLECTYIENKRTYPYKGQKIQ